MTVSRVEHPLPPLAQHGGYRWRRAMRLVVAMTLLRGPHGAAAAAGGDRDRELPVCNPRQLFPETSGIKYEAREAPADGTLPFTTRQCPYIRPVYDCGDKTPPNLFAAADGCRLAPWPSGSAPFANGSHVLITGNSYARQVFETLACQYADAVVQMETTGTHLSGHTAFTAVCHNEALKAWPDPHTKPGSYMIDDLARVTFSNGARMYGAFNGQFVYRGLDYLVGRLGVEPKQLDAVYLKHTNARNFSGMKKCPFPPGSGMDDLNDMSGFLEALVRRGFRGKVVVTEEFRLHAEVLGKFQKHDLLVAIPSAISGGASFSCTCVCPTCESKCGHQCIPGPIDMEAHLFTHALRWHVPGQDPGHIYPQ